MISNNNRKLKLLILSALTFIIIFVGFKYIYREQELIIIDEMIPISTTIRDKSNTDLKIHHSENLSIIEVNGERRLVNRKALFEILAKYKSKKTNRSIFPLEQKKIDVEINLVQNHLPKNIVLGDINFWYIDASGSIYEIIDGEKLLKEIINLAEKYEHLNHRLNEGAANMIFPPC